MRSQKNQKIPKKSTETAQGLPKSSTMHVQTPNSYYPKILAPGPVVTTTQPKAERVQ